MSLALRVIVLALVLPAVAYLWLGPDAEPHRVFRTDDERMARGWEVLKLWAAWPVLAIYGAPMLALAGAFGWAVGRARMEDERRALARREQAVTDHMREADRLTEEAKQARQRDQAIVANVKRDDVQLSRQAGRDKGKRVRAVGQLKRRRERENKLREQLAGANREIERLKRALPPESDTR